MALRLLYYFSSLYLTVTTCCYFSFGKHVIDTNGYMADTATLNNFDDFLILCFFSSFIFSTLFVAVYFIIYKYYQLFFKRNFVLKFTYTSMMYALAWLAATTSVAGACAVNWGNTWSYVEIFSFFVIGNAKIVLPLLGTGLLSILLLEKYLQKPS